MEGKNLQAAISGTKLSEKSAEALKSDTWQKARDVLQGGISETDVDASADCQIKKQIEESGEAGIQCSGGIGEKCEKCERAGEAESENAAVQDIVKNNMPENASGAKESSGSTKNRAKKKLEKELKKTKDKSFAEPVIKYLIKRCEEDGGLALDVMQKHKTWERCYGYICSEARKSAQKGARSYAVPDEVVYEWAEDYYHKDDRAEEEEKAKKAAEAKAKEKTEATPAAVKTDNQKAKKNRKDMEGQLDMFSMMGM